MKKKLVNELMVPLAKYASVSQEATLFEAVLALEKAQEKFDQSRYRHRAVLIYDNDEENIVGKVSQLDVMRALEPKYEAMGIPGSLSRFGLTQRFQETMLEELRFWDKPMDDICRKASRIKIKEFMYTPSEGEYINDDTTLDRAINQLVMGHHQSLLVLKDDKIVGILRATDVFMEIVRVMKACER
jgi:CBS domain-containing protein